MALKLHRQFNLGSWEQFAEAISPDFHDPDFFDQISVLEFSKTKIRLTGNKLAEAKFRLYKPYLSEELEAYNFTGKILWKPS